MSFISQHQDHCTIAIRVTARASRSKIAGVQNQRLKILLTSPAVENAANRELIDLISESLSIPKRQITIQHGAQSREKLLRIDGLSYALICKRLNVNQ